MIWSVSSVKGTSGISHAGKDEGNSPMSPTVRTSYPMYQTSAVKAVIAIRGDGTALVRRGNR